MVNLQTLNESVLQVQLGVNFILLIIGAFYATKMLVISAAILNLLFIGTYLIIKKYEFVFQTIISANKFAKTLNLGLEKLNQDG
jgi:uncharacterized membrane protein